MIISILAAAVLGVAAVAGETAREAKTRAIISRIHSLLMEQYDTYVNRRVKLNSNVLRRISALNANAATKGRLKAEARLYALREMMLMEVPDRWSDVLLAEVPNSSPIGPYPVLTPIYLEVPNSTGSNGRTEIANVYLRNSIASTKADNKITGNRNTRERNPRQPRRRVPLHDRHERLRRRRVADALSREQHRRRRRRWRLRVSRRLGASDRVRPLGARLRVRHPDTMPTNSKIRRPARRRTEAWAAAGSADHDPFDLYRTQPIAYPPGAARLFARPR